MKVSKCKNCGGKLIFNPKTQNLKCEYCSSDIEISKYENNNTNFEIIDVDINKIEEGYIDENNLPKGAIKTSDKRKIINLRIFFIMIFITIIWIIICAFIIKRFNLRF